MSETKHTRTAALEEAGNLMEASLRDSLSWVRHGNVDSPIIAQAARALRLWHAAWQLPAAPETAAERDRLKEQRDELLKAAKAVRSTCPCDPDINPNWNAVWDSLVEAIAKATT